MHRIFLIALAIGSLMLVGCSQAESAPSSRARTEGWSSIRLANTSRTEAFDAGVYAMKQWFRVEHVAPVEGEIRSAGMEYDQKGGTERLRDAALNYRNRMRRTAVLRVEAQGTDVVARCAVLVQRLDTADHRVFRDNQRFTDYPNETPIDRDAGVTATQDQVWTDMPRDRQLEQDILSVVRSRVSGGRTSTSAKAS